VRGRQGEWVWVLRDAGDVHQRGIRTKRPDGLGGGLLGDWRRGIGTTANQHTNEQTKPQDLRVEWRMMVESLILAQDQRWRRA
jgi:hypothetical protein